MRKRPFGLINLSYTAVRDHSVSEYWEGVVSKGQETKQEIVRKAAHLFNQKGYAGTSLSDLMDATGLQKGGIYRHFSGKEELATEAFDYSWQKAVTGRLEGALLISRLQKDNEPLHNARLNLHEYLERNVRAKHARSK